MAEIPVGYFPDVPIAWTPTRGKRFKTEILEMANGIEQRREKYVDGGYQTWSGSTGPLDQSTRKSVVEFLEAKKGALVAFYFFRPDPAMFTDYNCGFVNNQSTIIIPFKSTAVTGVKVAGATKTFTVQTGIGGGGEDQITFTGGAQTGTVTVTLTGRERVVVRNTVDDVDESFQQASSVYAVLNLAFKEVR